jgi:hypothetical protein
VVVNCIGRLASPAPAESTSRAVIVTAVPLFESRNRTGVAVRSIRAAVGWGAGAGAGEGATGLAGGLSELSQPATNRPLRSTSESARVTPPPHAPLGAYGRLRAATTIASDPEACHVMSRPTNAPITRPMHGVFYVSARPGHTQSRTGTRGTSSARAAPCCYKGVAVGYHAPAARASRS